MHAVNGGPEKGGSWLNVSILGGIRADRDKTAAIAKGSWYQKNFKERPKINQPIYYQGRKLCSCYRLLVTIP